MDRLKGTLAGMVGGVAGAYAMSQFQSLWRRSEDDIANEVLAQTTAKHVVGHALNRDELALAAPAVHYVFGSTVGALYGAAAEGTPEVRVGAGTGLGIALWAAADEVAMPLLGLSGPTTAREAELHLQSFAAHIVYGATTEMVRQIVRRALG